MLSLCIVPQILCCVLSSLSENSCKKFSCNQQGIKFMQIPKNYEPNPNFTCTQDKASAVFNITTGTLRQKPDKCLIFNNEKFVHAKLIYSEFPCNSGEVV